MKKDSKILVTGANGLVGLAIMKELKKQNYINVLGLTRKECNLLSKQETDNYFEFHRPEYVFNAAAKVGGIYANNTKGAEFIYENLMIQINVIDACHRFNTKKLLLLGSSCIYPRNCPQPIKEEYLLTSELEQTNEAYAIAKIAGLTMGKMYHKQYGCNIISIQPTNLFGPNDNFDSLNAHVIPSMIQKIHEAKIMNKDSVELWGTGTPKREFMYIEDFADATIFLMNKYNDNEIPINVGVGIDLSIRDLAGIISDIIGYGGKITWNTNYPDGTPRKLLDITKLAELGWNQKTYLQEGIRKTYDWFMDNYDKLRK